MNIMLIGNGGRESAIKWKIELNSKVQKVFSHNDLEGLKTNLDYINFAKQNKIDLTIVGSEDMLVSGIVDEFEMNNLKIFGPHKISAMLEGSKVFAKEFMGKYGVKTAFHKSFNSYNLAIEYLNNKEFPIVIKASGLAAGKGVFIVENIIDGEEILSQIMIKDYLGEAGREVIIEEYLEGVEASILSIFDGEKITPFISAKDHKKIGEGESGLNTGGMGVIAPNPFVTKEVYELFEKEILITTQEGLLKENMIFSGVIFFGLMITKKGVYLLEYNMRFGDPETQALLPLMESDLLEVIEQAMDGNLEKIKWKNANSCCVVMVSGGYPLVYQKGFEIKGIKECESQVFLAGVELKENKYYTDGGRVLGVVGIGENLDQARGIAYKDIKKIEFKDMYYRKDIGVIL